MDVVVGVGEDLEDAMLLLSMRAENQKEISRLKEAKGALPCDQAPQISPARLEICFGIHPWKACEKYGQLQAVLDLIRVHKDVIIGVGEIGLDFQPRILGDNPEEVKRIQQDVFSKHVDLAKELGLPVNCHSVSAG